MQPLVIIDIDRTGLLPADALAQAMGFSHAEVVGGMEQGLSVLAQRRPRPHYVVVDIGLHGDDALPALEHLMSLVEPPMRVAAVGNVNDLHFYRALKAIGIQEYFTHPAPLDELRAALLASQRAMPGVTRQEARQGRVIAFVGAASGDGSSTVALNCAHAMALDHRQPTVLVDMDYQFGMLARHLDLQAPFGLRELFEYPERGVDATLVSKMLLPYGGGGQFSVIAAPEHLRMLPDIRPDMVRDLINVLRAQFEYVVLDVPHLWLPWTAEALAQADRIVAVGQLWLRSLTHLSRMVSAWQEGGIGQDGVLVAVNRSGARYREAITPQDFEKVSLKPINFYLANDIKTVMAAENQGKTVLEVGHSPLERQVRDMARALVASLGGATGAVVVPPAAPLLPAKPVSLLARLKKG